MEVLRRFLLVGVAVLVSPGSITQLVVATVVSLVYLIVQMQARPFRVLSDDFIAMGTGFSLVALFYCW